MDAIVLMVLNHYVLHSPLIVLKELEIVSDSQVTARLYEVYNKDTYFLCTEGHIHTIFK